MEKEKPIKRIQLFAKTQNLSIRKFEEAAELRPNVIQNAVTRNSHVSDDTLCKIMDAFPQLNLKWVLKGTGEMLLHGKSATRSNSVQREPDYEEFSHLIEQVNDDMLAIRMKEKLFRLYQSNSDLKTELLRVYKLIGDI